MPLDPHELHFIESVTNFGVRMQTWKHVRSEIGPKKHYCKVVYRSVDFPRDEAIQKLLDQFIDEVIGHNYNISTLKLMKRNSTVKLKEYKIHKSSSHHSQIS